MPPAIATFLCIVGVWFLFRLDREQKVRTSRALWLPVVWLSIGSSRMASQWLGAFGISVGSGISTAEDMLDGSPFDRFFILVLVFVGLIVLFRRGRAVRALLQKNLPVVLFFFYCALSAVWSDFPLVSFKRWVKDLGDLAMILIVLTEQDQLVAIRSFLQRAGFVLVPASVLFIKYYPDIGRAYHPWTWNVYYVGVAGGKNELGMLCLIFGVASVWCLVSEYGKEKGERRKGSVIAHSVIVGMVLWLFYLANSATSWACFIMASTIIIVTSFRAFDRKPIIAHVLIASMLTVSMAALFFGTGSNLVESLGRDTTLTGRTDIWKLVLGMHSNPIVGTGFESFWLGGRLEKMWDLFWWRPNEAHNGYLEVYLNLGWIGVALLLFLLVTGYRNVISSYRNGHKTSRLKLAFFLVIVAYNFTESAVRTLNPIWVIFLLTVMAVPPLSVTEEKPLHGVSAVPKQNGTSPRLASASWANAQRRNI